MKSNFTPPKPGITYLVNRDGTPMRVRITGKMPGEFEKFIELTWEDGQVTWTRKECFDPSSNSFIYKIIAETAPF